MSDANAATEFEHNRSVAEAKREALADLRDAIEAAGYPAYVTEFDETTDRDGFYDTFEVRFVVGLSDTISDSHE